MNMSMATAIAVFIVAASIFGSFGMNTEYATDAKTDIKPDAKTDITSGASADGANMPRPTKGTTGLGEVKSAASSKDAAGLAEVKPVDTTGLAEVKSAAPSKDAAGLAEVEAEDTTGLSKVESAGPSKDTAGLAEVKSTNSSKGTAGLAEVKPVDTMSSSLDEGKAVDSIKASTKPKRKRVIGNSPAARAFAARQALVTYHEEKAARLAVTGDAPVAAQPESTPDPNGMLSDQTPQTNKETSKQVTALQAEGDALLQKKTFSKQAKMTGRTIEPTRCTDGDPGVGCYPNHDGCDDGESCDYQENCCVSDYD